MDAAGEGLTGDAVGAVARCGAVLVGPVAGAAAPCRGWWARLLVGAAFRHLWAAGGGRLPGAGALPAFVRRPASAVLADLRASPDDGARATGAVLGGLAADGCALAGVVAHAAGLLDRAAGGRAQGVVPDAAAVPRVPGARAARPRPLRRRG